MNTQTLMQDNLRPILLAKQECYETPVGERLYGSFNQIMMLARIRGVAISDLRPVEETKEEFDAIIEDGGVYWRCAECRNNGVIKKGPFSAAVRQAAVAPEGCAVGYVFSHCYKHGELE